MKNVKENIRKQVQMKILEGMSKIKDRILSMNQLSTQGDCPIEVTKAIEAIKEKISQSKLTELHPPFLPKTVTRYRHEYFMPLKRMYHSKITSQDEGVYREAVKTLYAFVANFDCELFDMYLEQIREPYIRKIFNENYEFDKIDFKEISNQYQIRSEVQNLLNSASEWLIQIERTQDLLERVQLYFDIPTPILIEKAKKKGMQSDPHRSLSDAFYSTLRTLTSYTLRKSSKVIQSSFFTSFAPAAAMLTLAIIGGSASLPWQSDINGKLLLAPILAITVPYLLDNLASTIERKEFIEKLEQWAVSLEKVGSSIAKFNEELEQTILCCCVATNPEEFQKQKTNLQRYVKVLSNSLDSLTNFSQEKFQEIRDRTEAYFKKYVQIEEGQWKVVVPSEQYDSWSSLGKHPF